MLLQKPSIEVLSILRKEFCEHCEKEEKMLFDLGFGNRAEELSATASHTKDHLRIISLMDVIIDSKSISHPEVDRIIQVLHMHAERFDALYAANVGGILNPMDS